MATIAMMIGGAVVNALAFSGSNFGFSLLNKSTTLEETKRHNVVMENINNGLETAGAQKE